MPGGTYERYGLNGNPFRDLASESLEDLELYHVNLHVDEELRSIKEEALEKENRAVVAITGPLGSGKTERLLLAASEARAQKAFVVYFDVTEKTTWMLKGLSEAFQQAAGLGGFARVFSAPGWLRPIAALAKIKDSKYDPLRAGRSIARALNENAPSFLLLNDLHNLRSPPEVDAFAKTLQEIADTIKPGVLVMFGCYANYMLWIEIHRPGLFQRINRRFTLPFLTSGEAGLLLAKKLLAKRIVEELDPLYPFDKSTVASINIAAGGNPRKLLQMADVALEFAVKTRANRVDSGAIHAALTRVSPQLVSPARPVPPSGSRAATVASRPAVAPLVEAPPRREQGAI